MGNRRHPQIAYFVYFKKRNACRMATLVHRKTTEAVMPILLWLVGIPIPIIIIAYLLMHH
jgi:hypothetical protein